MRLLTIDEPDMVSGGTGESGGMITVTAQGGSLAGLSFSGIPMGASFDISGLSVALEGLMASVLQSLIEAGIISDPNEIVVTGTIPPLINVGGGQFARFYPDGIAQIYVSDGDRMSPQGNATYTFDTTTRTWEQNSTLSLPSYSNSITNRSGSANYHFSHTNLP